MSEIQTKRVSWKNVYWLALILILSTVHDVSAQIRTSLGYFPRADGRPQITQRVIQRYLEIIERTPMNAKDQALSHYFIAQTLDNLGETEKAAFFYDKALQTLGQQDRARAYERVAEILKEVGDFQESHAYEMKSRQLVISPHTKIQILAHLEKKDVGPVESYEKRLEMLPPEERHHVVALIIGRYLGDGDYVTAMQVLQQLEDRFPESQQQEYDALMLKIIAALSGQWRYDEAVAVIMTIADEGKRQAMLERISESDMVRTASQLNLLKSRAGTYKSKIIDEPQFQTTLQTRYPEREFSSFDECFRHVFEDHVERAKKMELQMPRYVRLHCLIQWANELKRENEARELLSLAVETVKGYPNIAEGHWVQSQVYAFRSLLVLAAELGEHDMAEELLAMSKTAAEENGHLDEAPYYTALTLADSLHAVGKAEAARETLLAEVERLKQADDVNKKHYYVTIARRLGDYGFPNDAFETLELSDYDNLAQLKNEILVKGRKSFLRRQAKRADPEKLSALVNDESLRPADRIELLNNVIFELYKDDRMEEAEMHITALFALADRLAEKAEPRSEDDNLGLLKAGLLESFSHPVIRKIRESGDNAAAWDCARRFYGTVHNGGIPQIKQVTDNLLMSGELEKAMLMGEDQMDCLGPIIGELCKRGRHEEANRLLDKSLAVMAERGEIAHEMVIALVICGRHEEAEAFAREASKKAMLDNTVPKGQIRDRRFILSVFASYAWALLVLHEEKRFMELLEDWPNEEEKLAGIIMIVDWHTAGKCPDVVFSPEQVESWKSCLLSDARAEINVIPWERERRIALANVLANLGEIEAAGELLAEAFAMVERIQHHHKPQEAGMKLEVLRKIALRAAKLSEMDMAEAALFEILEICTTNEHVTNKIASARGAMNIYAAYFNRDNLENPETVFEHRETNSLRLQTDREYGSRVSFAPQCLSLPE